MHHHGVLMMVFIYYLLIFQGFTRTEALVTLPPTNIKRGLRHHGGIPLHLKNVMKSFSIILSYRATGKTMY